MSRVGDSTLGIEVSRDYDDKEKREERREKREERREKREEKREKREERREKRSQKRLPEIPKLIDSRVCWPLGRLESNKATATRFALSRV